MATWRTMFAAHVRDDQLDRRKPHYTTRLPLSGSAIDDGNATFVYRIGKKEGFRADPCWSNSEIPACTGWT